METRIEFGHPPIEQQAERPKPEFDAVIALGKNWRRDIRGVKQHEHTRPVRDENGNALLDWENNPLVTHGFRIQLSLESKMTALAAAELYKKGKVGKIIFSTGETAGNDPEGKPYPTEADEMKRFMRIFFSEDEIPESAVEVENKSFDTAGNAEEVKKMLDKEHIGKVALLSVGFHLPRAKRLFHNLGVNVAKSFGSEGVLRGRSPHYDRLISDYHWKKLQLGPKGNKIRIPVIPNPPYFTELGKEAVGVGLVYTLDPRGEKLRQQTLKTRHRIEEKKTEQLGEQK